MNANKWQIPPSMIRWLADIPPDLPVAVLLRHSVREEPLPPSDAGKTTPITPIGTALGRELGTLIGDRLQRLHTSPLPRCTQTAEAIRAGAQANVPIVHDCLLGDPGVYVVDGRQADSIWKELGHDAVMRFLMSGNDVPPGIADSDPAARFLVRHMLTVAGHNRGLHLFVTHDSLISATTARLFGEPLEKVNWPWYLEGTFFWQQDGVLLTAYRDRCRRREADTLEYLDERSVVGFARREVAKTVGLACGARFFLAGGAFKTLLTGRPPRDLDLWAPSVHDRELLVRTLIERGAHRLDDRPFTEAFEIADRTVELYCKTVPDTLEKRLAQFDLALSAIGVEHGPNDCWRPIIHPLAQTSIERRLVLLRKPLVNWEWALATLERMRRYANELQYTVPETEEAEVWRVFDAQPVCVKRKMLENYEQTASKGYGVREEALRRLR